MNLLYGSALYQQLGIPPPDGPDSGAGLSLPVSMLTINQRFAPEMAAHIVKTAPPHADVASWLY